MINKHQKQQKQHTQKQINQQEAQLLPVFLLFCLLSTFATFFQVIKMSLFVNYKTRRNVDIRRLVFLFSYSLTALILFNLRTIGIFGFSKALLTIQRKMNVQMDFAEWVSPLVVPFISCVHLRYFLNFSVSQ